MTPNPFLFVSDELCGEILGIWRDWVHGATVDSQHDNSSWMNCLHRSFRSIEGLLTPNTHPFVHDELCRDNFFHVCSPPDH